MPIRFFKSKEVKTGDWNETVIFTSSGTTGNQTSRHFVRDITLYETSFINGFKHFYGSPTDYVFLALLPSYLERTGSSLVYMVEKLMRLSGQTENGFYLHDTNELYQRLTELEKQNRKVILIGVSFALLDFAERFSLQLKNTIVMETGGMKGKREEMTRVELHSVFQKSFGLNSIHSEYGMTELFSQAYSRGEGRFFCPPWMKVAITAIDDPKEVLPSGKSGRINIIDLANIHSVAFIATDDLGKINEDGSFEILGRLDNSDLRGCNLLID